ncbi:DUF305 domain-containing protein [Nocardia sp. NPDC050630]|uniref:DUF305 domain-containing protein n=1 Tax=Nocardia sp. NPDC050630 TaxID=3364321 RepID=UPI0037A787A6
MTRQAWIRSAALVSLAVLLLAVGAAIRPLLIADDKPTPPVLTSIEIGFAQDMVAHHSQALLMTQRLDSGVDPTVRALAQQISDTQRTEIGMLLGWLRMARVVTINPQPMAWMHTHQPDLTQHQHATATSTAATADLMPGMATQSELDALAAAHGTDAQALFLQLMQRHHVGGIQMAQAADRQLSSGIVKQAARDMIDTQSREVGLMMLLTQRNTPS